MAAAMPRSLTPRDVREAILAPGPNGGELALLDVRETGVFSRAHLLFAVSLPLSRLELRIVSMVPRKSVAIVLCAGAEDECLIAGAAEKLGRFGYTDIAYLQGGIEAWRETGYELFSGVNVPSKAFGEFVETVHGTPHIKAEALNAMKARGDDLVILDSRPMNEFRKMNIPGGIDVPGAELAYRVGDIAPDPDTLVVVNCAGRTRSIIGAQSLINAGIPNRVVALENGTMGWHLAGFELEQGCERVYAENSDRGLAAARERAEAVAARFGVRRVDWKTFLEWRDDAARTTYLLDVRSPEEYRAGHPPGAKPAPGGQLVQATDEYVGVRGARLVLTDDDGVRATMSASWLIQMGWDDVFVLDGSTVPAEREAGPWRPPILGIEDTTCETVSAVELKTALENGEAVVCDLAGSLAYRKGHIPGAWFTIRSRLPGNLSKLPDSTVLVLTSKHGILARLAAEEALASGRAVKVLDGGTDAWAAAGYPLEDGFAYMADEPEDRWYKPYDLDEGNVEGMRQYLTWEVDLVGQIERDGTARFRSFT